MRKLMLACVFLGVAGGAVVQAHETDWLPLNYQVVGVEPGDRLNVRRLPDVSGEIITALDPGYALVDILEIRDGWGRVLAPGGGGWVSMAYLERAARPDLLNFDAPGGFECSGTEPFWWGSIAVDGAVSFEDAMSYGLEAPLELTSAMTARARPQPYRYQFANPDGLMDVSLTIDAQTCSDGMNDRQYGWRAIAQLSDHLSASRLLEGCCWTPLPETEG